LVLLFVTYTPSLALAEAAAPTLTIAASATKTVPRVRRRLVIMARC
jgi:hypothetical protein